MHRTRGAAQGVVSGSTTRCGPRHRDRRTRCVGSLGSEHCGRPPAAGETPIAVDDSLSYRGFRPIRDHVVRGRVPIFPRAGRPISIGCLRPPLSTGSRSSALPISLPRAQANCVGHADPRARRSRRARPANSQSGDRPTRAAGPPPGCPSRSLPPGALGRL